MATLKGPGSMQGISLIVHAPAKSVKEKDGKIIGRYLDVQVDQSLKNHDKILSGESKADPNPHLASYTVKHPDGGTYTAHTTFYSQSQIEAMEKAAGSKVVTLDNGDRVFGIEADVKPNIKKELIVATNKPMGPTKNRQFGEDILEKQAKVTSVAKEARDAAYAGRAAREAQEVEAEAPDKAAQQEGPELG